MDKYYLDPDYRRTPTSEVYCIRCQKTIRRGSDHMRVSVDWNTMEVWADNNGKYHIGLNCWNQIKKIHKSKTK